MPIYEFLCESCGRIEERLQKLTDPPPAACPECGGKMAKIMSRNSFQLKGGGWYKDLYSSAGAPPPAKEANGSDSTPSTASAPSPVAPSASPAVSSPATSAPSANPAPSKPSATGSGSSAGGSGASSSASPGSSGS